MKEFKDNINSIDPLSQAKEAVRNGDLKLALEILNNNRDISFESENEIYSLLFRINLFEKNNLLGTLEFEKFTIELNRLCKSTLDIIQNIEYKIKNKNTSTSCQIPLNYYLPQSQIVDLNDFIKNHASGLVLLCGPSGAGKSVFSSYIYNHFFEHISLKKWYNCDFSFSITPVQPQIDYKVVVFDNLYSNHEILGSDFFKTPHDKIVIVSSCDKKVADQLKIFCDFSKTPFKLIYFNGFSVNETFDYLRHNIPLDYITNEYLRDLSEIICPLPILWQISLDVIKNNIEQEIHESNEIRIFSNEKLSNINILDLNSSEGISNVADKIITSWFHSKNIKETEKNIIWVLANVPMIGMSPHAIRNVLGENKEIEEGLNRLVKIGLIKIYSNRQINHDQVIQVHELIKKIDIKNHQNIDDFRRRYIDYFNTLTVEQVDLATKIDILILKIKSGFDNWINRLTTDGFNKMMQDQFTLLEKAIPINSNSQIKSEWLAQLFRPLINDKTECSVLIGLGQTVSHLSPNRILGDTIWEGRNSYDGWAAACCINAAIHHWQTLNEIQKLDKRSDLLYWFRIELWKTTRLGPSISDLHVSAFLGGLCKLGFINEAIKVVNSLKFTNNFSISHVSVLTLLLFLIDHQHAETDVMIKKFYSKIIPSSAKKNLMDYASTNGYAQDIRDEYISHTDEKHMGQSVAKMAGSKKFSFFLKLRNENITYI